MKLQAIDESEFNQIDASRKLITHQHPRQFAIIDLGNELGRYGISWNSDLIEPMLKLSPDGQIVWVGVEQKLAAICTIDGQTLLILPLTCYLVQMLTLDDVTAVITEEELLIFNRRGSIRYSKALPDIAIGMSAIDEYLVIKLQEGETLLLDPQTCTFKQTSFVGHNL
ncbi:hypothetical protein [Argonema antarcticum]|uniref:hypothetical protein n=1 Tax=Argonema antarcticum TaxID=2942763 RepID=UPI002010D9B6|nr:hypothetical protein [Argonema antarcticum]MCL1471759.1 hypothetical protein [Argonema antarcticum A004/B2]